MAMHKSRQKSNQNQPQKCYFTQTNTMPNYKEVLILRRYLTDRGKILPASKSGVKSKKQRLLAQAIKRARYMALLPYTDRHAL